MDQAKESPYRPALTFDAKKAGDDYRIAVLPIVYERALADKLSPAEAKALVGSRLQPGESFELMRHQNVTAVVVHQPKSGKITVAFDGTEELRDKIDNMRFTEHDHPLGGKVHTGHLKAIAREDEQGHKISDRVKAVVAGYAAADGGVSELTMTGHSRGGALSMAATAEWMKEGLPAGTRLADVQTFGALPFGNEAFIQNFMSESARLGTRVTRVIAGNDEVPTYMANKKLFSDMYTHGGDAVYLLPERGGAPQSVLINPSDTILQAARKDPPSLDWHHPDSYAELLGVPSAKLPTSITPTYKDISPAELQVPPPNLPGSYSRPRSINP